MLLQKSLPEQCFIEVIRLLQMTAAAEVIFNF